MGLERVGGLHGDVRDWGWKRELSKLDLGFDA